HRLQPPADRLRRPPGRHGPRPGRAEGPAALPLPPDHPRHPLLRRLPPLHARPPPPHRTGPPASGTLVRHRTRGSGHRPGGRDRRPPVRAAHRSRTGDRPRALPAPEAEPRRAPPHDTGRSGVSTVIPWDSDPIRPDEPRPLRISVDGVTVEGLRGQSLAGVLLAQ